MLALGLRTNLYSIGNFSSRLSTLHHRSFQNLIRVAAHLELRPFLENVYVIKDESPRGFVRGSKPECGISSIQIRSVNTPYDSHPLSLRFCMIPPQPIASKSFVLAHKILDPQPSKLLWYCNLLPEEWRAKPMHLPNSFSSKGSRASSFLLSLPLPNSFSSKGHCNYVDHVFILAVQGFKLVLDIHRIIFFLEATIFTLSMCF
ncbi:hypothetical protein Scep_023835 [Stephania cephalantha]|uniref:Uncharacterized protein n=1 Tax=Stephania cephalantha TaxID=152367 RepID=A0AAP0EVD7_9MAGN